nr:PREDICTED: 2-hydroxyacylsphingosine 1-beta-galactosyltransferase-like [Bemisia tabaci]
MSKMNAKKYLICGIFLLNCVGFAAPARILFLFPISLGSHFRAFFPVVEELAARGHEITAYVNSDLKRAEPMRNYREIVRADPNATSFKDFDFIGMREASIFQYTLNLWNIFALMTDDALRLSALQDLMRSREQFDVIIAHGATILQEPLLGFAHKFGAPVINLHPIAVTPLMASLTGIPNPLSYVPDFRLPYPERMNFWQRINNLIIAAFDVLGGHFYFLPSQEEVMRRNFRSEALPPLRDLIANISLHLVLSHPMMHIRPYGPNVVQISGTQIKPATELPEDLKKFMDEAQDGVIYFSLGSFIQPSFLSDQMKRVLTETLKSVRQRVILKWPEKFDGDPKHIFQKSWLPQTAILAHPNCELFITHGGINSLVEVMTAGVPTLGLPMFADQFHNVAYYEHIGVGLNANIDDNFTIEEFTRKINRILNTPSFVENSKRWAAIYGDLPETSLERAVFWVEYVIRHKGAHHLKPASATMPFHEYMLLDAIAFCSAVFILILYILIWIVCKTLRILKLIVSSKGAPEKGHLSKKRD